MRNGWFRIGCVYLLIMVAVAALIFSIVRKEDLPPQISPQKIVSDARQGEIARLVISPDEVRVEYNDGTVALCKTYGHADLATALLGSPELATTIPELVFSQPSLFNRLWSIVSPLLPAVVVLITLWILFGRQQASSEASSFFKSRARMYVGDHPTVTFEDVAGIGEAKESIDEIVHFLKEPEIFISIGARIPRGVLLSGPPGCGKTLLAKAVSSEAGVPFFSISASEFVEVYRGAGAARIRDLFDQAKRNSPCIVFIDHLDSVGFKKALGISRTGPSDGEEKGGRDVDERIQTLNQLLDEMDGFDTDENVIVIGATERPDLLDPALLRPGRIDRHIKIDLPDKTGRKQILEVHVRGKPLTADVDLTVLASKAEGFNGADIETWINEAAFVTAKRKGKAISMDDFEDALGRIQTERLDKKTESTAWD